jgi:FeoB-associated Cys-rich membrane protein
MSGQMIVALLLIGCAAAFVLVSLFRSLTGKKGCGGGCRCARKDEKPPRSGMISLEQVKERK